MSEGGFLPPLILELRAKGGEFFSELGKARKEIASTAADAERHGTRMERSFQGAAKVGKVAFFGLGAAAVVGGAAALKMGGDYQQSVTLLETGAGESSSKLKMVSDGMLKMAGSVGVLPEELSKGMYQIESAGFHGAKGLNVLRAAAEGSKTDGAALETVADALTTALTDMGDATTTPAQMMSKMVVAVGEGKMRMEDFASSIHSVLPNAAAMGLSFAQVGGAVATMTAEGISAQQATQNLNHTIVKLAAPTAMMTSSMASYGLSASDVAAHLGKRGLTGTLGMLTDAITAHMGPAGLTLRSAFNQSKEAAADAKKMMDSLPPSVQGLAKSYAAGGVTIGGWRAHLKNLPGTQAVLLQQWKAMQDKSHGFSDSLKAGGADAQTYTAALKSMLGDQTGLQVALHLSGEHADTFNANVLKIAGTTSEAGGHVRDWKTVQKNFNQQLAEAHAGFDAIVTTIGVALIPTVISAMNVGKQWAGYLGQHHTVLVVLAGTIGTLVVGAILVYLGTLAVTAAASVIAFGKMTVAGVKWAAQTAVSVYRTVALYAWYYGGLAVQAVAAGARWLAVEAVNGARWVATSAAQGAVWLAGRAVTYATQTAQAVASGAVWVAAQVAAGATWVATSAAQGAVWLATRVAAYVAQAAAAVVSAATTAAAWIAANAAMILATGGIILAIGLLIVAGIYLWKHWHQIWAWIKGAAASAKAWIGAHLKQIAMAFGPIGLAAYWLKNHWRQVWAAIQSTTAAAWSFIQRIFGFLKRNGLAVIRLEISGLKRVWGAVWSFVSTAVQRAWNTIRPIIDAVKRGIGTVTSAASTIGGIAGKVGGLLGFDKGGYVPGPKGAPLLAVVHGGEYVVSNDEQAGRSTSGRRGTGPAGVGSGSGATDIRAHLYIDGREVYGATQRHSLIHNRRNRSNGLALTGA